MDWLRSEERKEEMDGTAPTIIVAVQGRLILSARAGTLRKSTLRWLGTDMNRIAIPS